MAAFPSIYVLGDTMATVPSLSRDDLIVPLMILLLGMVLGIGVICLLLVGHFLKSGQVPRGPGVRSERAGGRADRPGRSGSVFAPPSRWLAIRTTHVALIQKALGLQRANPCSWEEGLWAAQSHQLFITPPIRGWVLVLGDVLPDPADDVDQCFRLVHQLSRKLGRVQYYSQNRALNHHAWALANDGQILRAYAWAGHTLWLQGRKTRDEIELGMTCLGYTEASSEFEFSETSTAMRNTEKLALLAARWSVDPGSVEARCFRELTGIAGDATLSIAY